MSRGSIALGRDMDQRVQSEEAFPDSMPGVPLPALTTAGSAAVEVGAGAADRRQRLAAAVSSHFALVWRSVRRFGVPERMADDAAQEVFITFSERLESVPGDRERPFLIAVAARVAANVRRKLERSREFPSDQIDWAAGDETPEDLLHHKQRRQELERALDALPFDQRTVFVLYELEGYSLPEIAEALEIPLGTATSRLRRARDKFEVWVSGGEADGGEP